MNISSSERRKISKAMRKEFAAGLHTGIRVVWPVLSALFLIILGLGTVVGIREGWSIQESLYFSMVTGLTIGYGDLSPTTLLTRVLSIVIGMCGVLVTALIAAIAVKALTNVTEPRKR
jgi:hypothetical protein